MGKVVMTVDDSASVRQMVSLTLSDAGYTIVEAVDGKDAMTKLTGSIQLVITDLNMPNMDGIELIRSIRATPAYRVVPIVMLTTESEESRKQMAKAAGATAWIVKPFTKQQMLTVIKKILGP